MLKPYQNSSFAALKSKKYILLLLIVITYIQGNAQKKFVYDSLPKLDSIARNFHYKTWLANDAPTQKMGLPFAKKQNNRNFFIALSLLAIFAIIRAVFSKYVKDIWQVTLQNTFRLSGIKAQLSANVTASFLMNFYFAIVLGCFLNILLQYQNIVILKNNYLQLLLCCTVVGIIYTVKYLSIFLFGILFQQKKASNDYLFIIFLCNKIIAMLLLPIVCYLLIVAQHQKTFIVIALFIICVLFLFRYLFSLLTIAKQLQMQKLHFFLYLCTTELVPLLLAGKLLLMNGVNVI